MKKLILVLMAITIGLSFLFSRVSFAEDKADMTIFKYKKELSITDEQEKILRDILAKLESYLAEKQKELNLLRAELNKMILDRDDLIKIKVKLENIAKIQADATYEDMASTRAIETALTGTQLSKWRSMQEEFRKNLQEIQAAASKAKETKK